MATRNNRQAVRNGGAAVPGWALFLAGVVPGILLVVMFSIYAWLVTLREQRRIA